MIMTLNIDKQVLSLLEQGLFKTTDQIVEEFRMEYPDQWKALEEEGEMLYGNGCSSVQQPATRISQVLSSFQAFQVVCLQEKDKKLWSINE